MGKGKNKTEKLAIIISGLVGVIAFVIAGFYFKRHLKLDNAETGLIATAIGGVFGYISTLINNLMFSSKNASTTISPEIHGDKSPTIVAEHGGNVPVIYNEASPALLDRLERLVEDKVKRDHIIEELQEKLKETEGALKERGVSQDAIARFEAGDYTEAEDLFARELKEGAEKAANAAYYLGNIKLAQLMFDEALKYYQQAVELDPKNPLYLNNLGFIYNTLGKYQEAIKHYEKALSINRDVHGGKHPVVATNLNNLGEAWRVLGKYEKAIEFYEQALSIDKEVYGERHPVVAIRLNNLGAAWYALGKYEKAIGYYDQSLSIDKEVYRERHPDVATDLNNLGGAWKSLGDYEQAREYYKQALSIDWMVYGKKHPDVARDLNNLGLALKFIGENEKARENLTMAYKVFVEMLGEDHPSTRGVKGNLDSLPR